ncbi:putative manganese resistance 1 protein [Cardiosporidium cionae]|uniref:Manganese resistance 1 protein n=1 Tax=Cardiosporidium cionae TaxID=476202 RepID=A0ABQ7J884_9APIC|nr:putative manganese resistance 1 protein [Cardiosporidium cionae]|eukprot:KAF8820206.1 putative manganese resistance 1 protein [Cardiosporidium cionae]
MRDFEGFLPLADTNDQLPNEKKAEESAAISPNSVLTLPTVTPRPSFYWPREIKGLKKILLTKINILLFFIPFGILSWEFNSNALLTFAFNFIALVPLSSLLGAATEELALHTGEIAGGLLNASFGNAVEMIMAFQALRKGLIVVVQGTLLGSILSNLLLVLGTSFFVGGLRHHVQKFNEKGATCSTSLLFLASFSISIPTLGKAAIENGVEKEHPSIGWVTGVLLLLVITIVIAFISEFLVSSIDPLISNYNINTDFIGVILLPIVGNAAEHLTAVTVAAKNKVDLTIGVAIGSSAQVALLVVPFTVISGWIIGQEMTLAFPVLSALALILSVIVVTGIVQDGESNWLEGVMLVMAYLLVAVLFWYYK